MPVLFLLETMIGWRDLRIIKGNFPKYDSFKIDVGHIPFLVNKPDLDKSINLYNKKYRF